MRAKDNMKSTAGYRSRSFEDTESTDPSRSPIFQSTIARGMKASGCKITGASVSGTTEVIFARKTGATDEMQRQEKFASAGHFSAVEIRFHVSILSSFLGGTARRLRLFKKRSALSEAKPTKTAERK